MRLKRNTRGQLVAVMTRSTQTSEQRLVKSEKSGEHSKEVTEAADRGINRGFWGCKLQPDNQERKVHINAVSKAKPTLTKCKERQHALDSLRHNELRGRNKMNNNLTA